MTDAGSALMGIGTESGEHRASDAAHKAISSPLLEATIDKVDTEIPSPAAGVLTKIIAREDDTVEVGGELAVIGDAAQSARANAWNVE
jgi:cell division GTPase FtsZ